MEASLKTWREHYLQSLSGYWGPEEAKSLFYRMLEHVSGLKSTHLHTQPDYLLPAEAQKGMQKGLERLAHGEPLQYITGETDFYGLRIACSPAALIPRPETEELIQLCESLALVSPVHAADIGTGTGCIALALKKIYPMARVTGLDISREALDLAQNNAALNDLSVVFESMNILDAEAWKTLPNLDLLVSNPPYVDPSEAAEMRPHVLNHEPHLALFTKQEPLEFYRALAIVAQEKLNPDGWVALEINPLFADETRSLFEYAGLNATVHRDIFGRNRFVLAQKRMT